MDFLKKMFQFWDKSVMMKTGDYDEYLLYLHRKYM